MNRLYTRDEVASHCTADDAWIIILNKVYEVTNWIPKHPGGPHFILNLAGQDCTDEFKTFHLEPNYKRLKPFYKGEVIPVERREPTALAKDVDKLFNKLKGMGAFEPDYWFYFKQASIIIALLYGAIYFMQYASSSLGALVLSAIQLGFFWQQLAFVGHDLGHHVVTHDRKLDDVLSAFFGNFLQGISLEWWKHNHNTHHTLTNSISHDPDIQHLPFMAVSKDYFQSIFSNYYQRTMKFDGLAEYFVSMQHYMFYPIMSLARFNLYAQSLIYNTVGPGSLNSKKYVELVSLFGFWIWLSYFLSFTGSWTNALLYLFVSHAAAGLVHVQICINHFSMETYNGIPQRSFTDDGYIRSQLMTTTDIDCPPFMDFFHGGLQFQIEHHIFPHITRSYLRFTQAELRKICAKHGLPYFSKPFFKANFDVLKKLYETSKELKLSEMIVDGLNMSG